MSSTAPTLATNAPISRVPTEVLEKIFACILDGCCQRSHPGKLRPVTILCLVCQHWRNTIYSCGYFWRTIDLSNEKRAKFNLQKAGIAPLDVYFTPGTPHRPPFPAVLFSQHTATMEEVEITDAYPTLLVLAVSEFPILKKLVFDNTTQLVEMPRGIKLSAHLPQLQELRLRRIILDNDTFLNVLRQGTLRCLVLMEVIFNRPLSINARSISVPRLKEVRLELPELPPLLFGMRDIPRDAIVDVGLPAGYFDVDMDADPQVHEFWRGLYPLRWLQSRVIFMDARAQVPFQSRDRHPINVNVLFNYAFSVSEVDSCLLEQTEPLDMVELEMPNRVRLSLAELPPFRAISLTADTVMEGLEQLKGLSDASVRVLEHIVLEDVSIAKPEGMLDNILPTLPLSTGATSVYAALVRFLKARSEQGRRIRRVTLRECYRKSDVETQDGLRLWADEVLVESSAPVQSSSHSAH